MPAAAAAVVVVDVFAALGLRRPQSVGDLNDLQIEYWLGYAFAPARKWLARGVVIHPASKLAVHYGWRFLARN